MATKSMGHLGFAARVVLSTSAAVDMTTINGSSSPCDFSQFNCAIDSIAPDRYSLIKFKMFTELKIRKKEDIENFSKLTQIQLDQIQYLQM